MKVVFVFPLCAMLAVAAALVEGRVVDATGKPLAGAAISTRLTLTEFRKAVSDANGEFKLDLPSDRAFSLSVSRGGYLNQSAEIPQRQPDASFAMLIRLTPEAVISGRVMDQDGLPVAGVDVAALSYQFSDGERFLGSSTLRMFQTDDTGQYRMFGLMAGAYFIRADPSNSLGKTDGRYHLQFYGDTVEPLEQNLVTVAAGQVKSGVDFRLRRHEGVAVSGRIVLPAVDPSARFRRAIGSVELDSTGIPRLHITARPASDNSFTFAHVLPAEYKLSYRSTSLQFQDGDLAGKQVLVRVGKADVPDLRMELQVAHKVDLAGKVAFQDGATPQALSIGIDPPDFEDLGSGSTISTEDGSFVLKGLRPRHYKLRIVSPGMNNPSRLPNGVEYIFAISIKLGGQETGKDGFDLDGTADPGQLTVVMSARGAKMRGRALLKDRTPRVNASLWLMPSSSSLPICLSTDQDGYFTITNIPPGDYHAYFFDNGAGPNSPGYFNDHMNDYPALHLQAGVNAQMTLTQR